MDNVANENQPAAIEQEPINGKVRISRYGASLGDMINRVKNEPKLEMMYSGIKEKSVGIVFGPSKSGKTMYCENLAMCIAAGAKTFLGLPLRVKNHKVVFISYEEHYTNRTERNTKQIDRLVREFGEDWLDNYIVSDEHMPRYINSKDDWLHLASFINEIKPGIVFLDSLTHMYQGGIEDSRVAVELMSNLRWLSDATDTTVVAIHHTHKMFGQRLSIDNIAGSRVVAQETDFMIGLNRTPDGRKYIKDVAFRYIPSNDETVRTYEISDDCWINVTGEAEETKVLSATDGRKDDATKNMILEFMNQQKEAGVEIVQVNTILERFVAKGEFTRTTVFNNINKLLDEKGIIRYGKGAYSLAA